MRVIGKLNQFLRPFAGKILLSVLAGAGTVASSVLLLGTSAFLISKAALQPSIAELQVAIVGVRFFGICRGLLRYLERLSSHSVNLQVLSRMRVWFFQKIEPLVPARLQQYRGGDLLSRSVYDIETLENYFIRVVSPPLVWGIITALTAWYLLQHHTMLAIVYLVGGLVTGVLIPIGAFLIGRAMSRQVQADHATFAAELVDYYQGYVDLLMAGQLAERLDLLKAAGKQLTRTNARLTRVNAAFTALHLASANLTMAIVLIGGAWLVAQGALEGLLLGMLVLVALSSFEASQPLVTGAAFLHQSLEAAERLFAVTEQPPAVVESLTPLPLNALTRIEFKRVTFNYPNGLPVVDGIDLVIEAGERVALLGPSGAGKTTLAAMLVKFVGPNGGTLRLNHTDIGQLQGEDVRGKITLLPQQGYLFAGSLRDNLWLGNAQASDEEMLQVLNRLGLSSWLEKLPKGLDAELGENGVRMSAGERQRLNLARSLLRPANLLILDEPTANLDTITAEDIRQKLLGAECRPTILWITHQLSGLQLFDRIVVLLDGKIKEQGSFVEISKSGGYFSRLLDLQRSYLQ